MQYNPSHTWLEIRHKLEIAELSGKVTALAMALFFILQVLAFSLPAQAATICASWNQVTTNSDGSALTDFSNYVVHAGSASHSYSLAMNAGTSTSHCFDVNPGHYCVMVTAFDLSGNESLPSSEACIDVAEGAMPTPTPVHTSPARAIPQDFTGAGVSNIVTAQKSGHSSNSPQLFTIYNTDSSVSAQITLGKFGNKPVIADYDGDGKSDLAVVTSEKSKLVWNIRNNTGTVSKVKFGRTLSSIVGGCHFDSDLLADETIIESNRLQYIKSASAKRANIRLANLPASLKGVACADLDGDGTYELIVVGKGYKPGVNPRKKGAKQTWQLISYNAITGKQISNIPAINPSGLLVADINNDGIPEMAYVGRSSDKNKVILNFFVTGSSSPVPIDVAKFSSAIPIKLGNGSGRVANGLAYTPRGSQAVMTVSFEDLIANATGIVLSKPNKEKLVLP